MNWVAYVGLPLAGLILGWSIRWLYARYQLAAAEQQAVRVRQDAVKEAEAQKKEILVEAKDQLIRERNQQERENRERRAELQRYERRVEQKEETLDKKIEALEKEGEQLKKKLESVAAREEDLSGQEERYRQELERISGLSAEEAKKLIIQGLDLLVEGFLFLFYPALVTLKFGATFAIFPFLLVPFPNELIFRLYQYLFLLRFGLFDRVLTHTNRLLFGGCELVSGI